MDEYEDVDDYEDFDDEDDIEYDNEQDIDEDDDLDTEFDEDDKESKLDDEYVTDQEEDDDITEFQKMLDRKQKLDFRTQNRLTKYEFAALVGYRAQQIAEGGKPYVHADGLSDTLQIALKELNYGYLPLMIERPIPSNKMGKFKYETRTVNELINVNWSVW